jgi:hypothetical protein
VAALFRVRVGDDDVSGRRAPREQPADQARRHVATAYECDPLLAHRLLAPW